MEQIATIILSAGYSARMKEFKPLLPFRGEPCIKRIIRSHREAGVGQIIVVTGHRGEELRTLLEGSGVRVVENKLFEQGMFTSVQKGITALQESVTAYLIQPVDVPLVRAETIKSLMDQYQSSPYGILYPVFDGQKGHPPLVSRKYDKVILSDPGTHGLREILLRYKADTGLCEVCDPAVLMDMDHWEDYEALVDYEEKNLALPTWTGGRQS